MNYLKSKKRAKILPVLLVLMLVVVLLLMNTSASAADVKSVISLDSLTVRIDGTTVWNGSNVNLVELQRASTLSFDLTWTVKDLRYIFQNGNYFTFNILSVNPSYLELLPPFKDIELKKNGVHYANGSFGWSGTTLQYTVTFTDKAKNVIVGGGTAAGRARFKLSEGIIKVPIDFDDKNKGEFEVDPDSPPPGEGGVGEPTPEIVWPPVPPPRDDPDLFKGLVSDDTVDYYGAKGYSGFLASARPVPVPNWLELGLEQNKEYYGFTWIVPFYGLKELFEKKPDRAPTDYVIVEDIISANLRFAGFEKNFPSGGNANLDTWFFNATDDPLSTNKNFFSVSVDLGSFNLKTGINYATDTVGIIGEGEPMRQNMSQMLMYQSQFTKKTTEAEVRATPLTYAVINLPDGRQKLIVNLGKFGYNVPKEEQMKSNQMIRDFTKGAWLFSINNFLHFQKNESPYDDLINSLYELEEILKQTPNFYKNQYSDKTKSAHDGFVAIKAAFNPYLKNGALAPTTYDTPIPETIRFYLEDGSKYWGQGAEWRDLNGYIKWGQLCGEQIKQVKTCKCAAAIPAGSKCPTCTCCNCENRNILFDVDGVMTPVGVHVHSGDWGDNIGGGIRLCKDGCNCEVYDTWPRGYIQAHSTACKYNEPGGFCTTQSDSFRKKLQGKAMLVDRMLADYSEYMDHYADGAYERAADGMLRGLLFHYPNAKNFFSDMLGLNLSPTLTFDQTITAIRAAFYPGSPNFDYIREMYEMRDGGGWWFPVSWYDWQYESTNPNNPDGPNKKVMRDYFPVNNVRAYEFNDKSKVYPDNTSVSAVHLWYRTVLIDETVQEFSNEVKFSTNDYKFEQRKDYIHSYKATIWVLKDGEVGVKKADGYAAPDTFTVNAANIFANSTFTNGGGDAHRGWVLPGGANSENLKTYSNEILTYKFDGTGIDIWAFGRDRIGDSGITNDLLYISIDGKLEETVSIKHFNDSNGLAYSVKTLTPGTHTVTIRGAGGPAGGTYIGGNTYPGHPLGSFHEICINYFVIYKTASRWDYNIDGPDFAKIPSGIEGAKFEVRYSKDNVVLQFTKTVVDGVPVYTRVLSGGSTVVETGRNGTYKLEFLPPEDIYLVEIGADGYYTGNKSDDINVKNVGTNVAMYDVPSGVGLRKDNGGEGEEQLFLNGAVFQIYKKDGANWKLINGIPVSQSGGTGGFTKRTAKGITAYWYSKSGTVTDLMTDTVNGKPGYIYVFGLPAGDYKFVETVAPLGYKLTDPPIEREFTVAISGTPTAVTITDALKPSINGGVTVYNRDNTPMSAPDIILFKVGVPEDNLKADGDAMSGIGFKLYKISDYPAAIGGKEKFTDSEGCVTWTSKELGTDFAGFYMLDESTAPKGVDPIDPIRFEIDADGKIIDVDLGANDPELVTFNNLTNTLEFKVKNSLKPGMAYLQVKKTVLTADKNVSTTDNTVFEFTITPTVALVATGENANISFGGTGTGAIVGNGSAGKFTLTNGATATISGLAPGTVYTVAETTNGDYTTTFKIDAGTETAGLSGSVKVAEVQVKSIEFINKLEPKEIKAEINGKKIITHIDPTDPKTFTFNLEWVDEKGVAKSPAYKQTKTVTNKGAGEHPFKFTIPDGDSFTFEPGKTYYFKVKEITGSDYGWHYDNNSYIVVVVVNPDRTVEVYYPQPGDPKATKGVEPDALPDTSSLYFRGGFYEFNTELNGSGTKFLLFCADKYLGPPTLGPPDNSEKYDRDYRDLPTISHTPSALAYALYTQLTTTSSADSFLELFGFKNGVTYPFLPVDGNSQTITEKCKELTAFLIWYYEFKAIYPEYDWDPEDLSKWPETLPAKAYPLDTSKQIMARGSVASRFYNELHKTYNVDYSEVFVIAVKTIDAMMDNYKTVLDNKCITAINAVYKPNSDTSGWLSFLYEGYIPPNHQLTLKWTTKLGMTVTIKNEGGTSLYTGSTSGTMNVTISDKFYIECSGDTGSVEFTLEDNMNYLMNGSIEGKYYISYEYSGGGKVGGTIQRQRMLIGFAQFGKINCKIEIGKGDSVIFKNKYQEPTIDTKIKGTKIVNNDITNKIYTFRLQELTKNGDGTFTNKGNWRETNGTVANGFSFNISKLKCNPDGSPKTYYYKITEIDPADGCKYDDSEYIVEVTVTHKGNNVLEVTKKYLLNDKEVTTVKFTNTYEPDPGNLKITKDANGNPWDIGEEFTFTVIFSGSGLDFKGIVSSNPAFTSDDDGKTWTVKLKKGTGNDSVTFTKIPIGATYTITEAAVTNYNCSSITAPGATVTIGERKVTGDVKDAILIEVEYQNDYITPTGNLEITKQVEGNPWEDGEEFTFTVIFSGSGLDFKDIKSSNPAFEPTNNGATWTGKLTKGAPTVSFTRIPIGATYTITEIIAVTSDYICVTSGATIMDGGKKGVVTGNISGTSVINVLYKNEYTKGSLTLTKDTVGNAWKEGEVFKFKLVFSNPVECANTGSTIADIFESDDGGKTWTGTLTYGKQSVKFTDIPIGTAYSITEIEAIGYECTGITTAPGGIATPTVSEGKITGSITATNLDITVAYENAPLGSLTLTKSTVGNAWKAGEVFKFTIVFSNPVECANTGSTTADIFESDDGKTWTGTLTYGKQSVKFTNILRGTTYTITEIEAIGYECTGITTAPGGIATPSISEGKVTGSITGTNLNITVTYENAPLGSLTLTKDIEGGNNLWEDGEVFDFTIVFSNPVECDDDSDGPDKFTPTNGGKTWTGKLTYDKQSVLFKKIPIGTTYTVTEVIVTDYKCTGITAPGGTATITNGGKKGEISSSITGTNLNITVAYENAPLGSLTLTKNVTGSPWEDGEAFEFTVVFSNPVECANTGSTTADKFESSNGGKTWSGKLTFGKKTVTFTNIPIDTTYEITEAVFTNYNCVGITKPDGATVTIGERKITGDVTNQNLINVTYTNDYVTPTGSLTITKQADGNPWDIGEEFQFTIELSGAGADFKNIKSNNLAITTSNNGTTWTGKLKKNKDGAVTESVTLTNIPIGTTYEITEIIAITQNYKCTAITVTPSETGVVKNISTGKVDGTLNSSTINVLFTNEYITGNLTLTKNIEGGNNLWVSGEVFDFTIVFSNPVQCDNTDSTIADKFESSDGGKTWSGKLTYGKQSVKFTKIPIGTTYTITEIIAVTSDYVCESVTGGTASITNGGKTGVVNGSLMSTNLDIAVTYRNAPVGSLTLTKNVADNPWEDGETFDFTVVFSGVGLDFKNIASATFASTDNGVTWTGRLTKGAPTVTFTKIPMNAAYEITEIIAVTSDYICKSITPGATAAITNGGKKGVVTGSVTTKAVINVTYTNEYIQPVGSLTITKALAGEHEICGADSNTVFYVKVRINGTSDYLIVEGNAYKGRNATGTAIQIKAGQTVTIGEIPAGLTLVVEEQIPLGALYTAGVTYSASGTNVTVVKDGTVSATVTNTYTMPRIPVSVTKEWVDAGNETKRPSSSIFKLYADSLEVTSMILAEMGAGLDISNTDAYTDVYTWSNLPKYNKQGAVIVYTVSEILPAGYEQTETGSISGDPFVNTYNPSILQFTARKTINPSNVVLKDGQFTFALYSIDNEEGDNPSLLQSKTNIANGSITFDSIDFAQYINDDYWYEIREESPSDAKWTCDNTIYRIQVTIIDGKYETVMYYEVRDTLIELASENPEFPPELTFSNTFSGDCEAEIEIGKTVDGMVGNGSKTFTFELVKDNTVTRTATLTTANIKLAQTVKFPVLTYTQADIGTHRYTISEVSPGNNWNIVPDINVCVTVAYDPITETLYATVEYYDGESVDGSPNPVTLENIYTPLVTKDKITVSKDVTIVSGTPTVMPTFVFTLRELNSATVNDFKGTGLSLDGSITGEGAYTFDIPDLMAGVYYYQINETGTAGDNWTYDFTPRIVTVTVTEDTVNNKLNVSMSVTTGGRELTFTNTYDVPTTVPTTAPTTEPTTTPTTTAPTDTPPPLTNPTDPTTTTEPTTTPTTNPTTGTTEPTSSTTEATTSTTEPTIDTSEPETTTEPTASTPEPTTVPLREPDETEPDTEPTIETSETTGIPTTTAEPSTTETDGDEDFDDDRIPLSNGWYAVPLGDDLYEIFDQNGVPLGYVQLKPGENIEDWEDFDDLIPLIPFPDDEVPKQIPKTGDIIMIAIFMLIAAAFGVVVALRKKVKRFFIN